MDPEVLKVLAALNLESAKELVSIADRLLIPPGFRGAPDVDLAITPGYDSTDANETAYVSVVQDAPGEPVTATVEIRDLVALAIFGARVALGAVERIPTDLPD